MVLPDWGRPTRTPLAFEPERDVTPTLARPLARLGAVIIDVGVVLTPIHLLLTAPFKREMTTAMLVGDEVRVAVFAGLMAVVAVLLLVTYQTISHYRFGRTLGKRVFRLRVISLEDAPRIAAHLARALTWLVSVALAGVPFWGVFAHRRRRPLHDRVGDTMVVAEADGVGRPSAWSVRTVRLGYALVALLVLLGTLGGLRDVVIRLNLDNELLGQLDPRDLRECDVVTQNVGEAADDDDHGRVRVALTLFAAGLADRTCLEREVDREGQARTPGAGVTDLARAFVNADDPEISNAYLDHVCAADGAGVECAMSRLISGWSDGRWDEVGDVLASAPAGSGYLEVWGVRHYLKRAQFTKALDLLDRLVDRPEVASFSLTERTKALYGGYRVDEGRIAYRQALTGLGGDESRALSAWTCAVELGRGCGALNEMSCGQALKSNGEPADAIERLVSLRARECRGDAPVDYAEMLAEADVGGWRTFLRANLKAERRDLGAAVTLFTKVLTDESAVDVLRVEATRRLTAIATAEQMRDLVERWGEVESRETWVHAGRVIFDQLARANDPELTARVARALDQDEAPSQRAPASTDER